MTPRDNLKKLFFEFLRPEKHQCTLKVAYPYRDVSNCKQNVFHIYKPNFIDVLTTSRRILISRNFSLR